jgi:hypothetical protein
MLLSACVTACGVTAHQTGDASRSSSGVSVSSAAQVKSTSTVKPPGGYLDDGDGNSSGNASELEKDIENGSYHDGDDRSVVDFGHAASAADERVVANVVRRYYAAVAAGDGAEACSLLEPSMAKSIAGNYGGTSGPFYLRGAKTCPALMALVLKHFYAQMTAATEVTGVRIGAGRAVALLGSSTVRPGYISLQAEGGTWRIGMLTDEPLL